MEIVRGAVTAASEVGLTVSLTSLSDGMEQRSWLDHISARGTRGIILLLARLGHAITPNCGRGAYPSPSSTPAANLTPA